MGMGFSKPTPSAEVPVKPKFTEEQATVKIKAAIDQQSTISMKLVNSIVTVISKSEMQDIVDKTLEFSGSTLPNFLKDGKIKEDSLDGFIKTITKHFSDKLDLHVDNFREKKAEAEDKARAEAEAEAEAARFRESLAAASYQREAVIELIKADLPFAFDQQFKDMRLPGLAFIPFSEKEQALASVLNKAESEIAGANFDETAANSLKRLYRMVLKTKMDELPSVVAIKESVARSSDKASTSSKKSVFPSSSVTVVTEGSNEDGTASSSEDNSKSYTVVNKEKFIKDKLEHFLTNKRKVMLRSIQKAYKDDPNNKKIYENLWVTFFINAFKLDDQGGLFVGDDGKYVFQENTVTTLYEGLEAKGEITNTLKNALDKEKFSDNRRLDLFDSDQQDYGQQLGRLNDIKSYLITGDFVDTEKKQSIVTGVYNHFAGHDRLKKIFAQVIQQKSTNTLTKAKAQAEVESSGNLPNASNTSNPLTTAALDRHSVLSNGSSTFGLFHSRLADSSSRSSRTSRPDDASSQSGRIPLSDDASSQSGRTPLSDDVLPTFGSNSTAL